MIFQYCFLFWIYLSLDSLHLLLVDYMHLESMYSRFSSLWEYIFLRNCLLTIWIQLECVITSPFSSLTLSFWVFSSFLLVSLARCLSICLYFQRTNSLFLYIVVWVSVSLISALIFILLCTALDFFCLVVLRLWGVSLGYLFEISLTFKKYFFLFLL